MVQVADLLAIDRDANAAYIRFSREVSGRTQVLNNFVNVDLDSPHRSYRIAQKTMAREAAINSG